MLYTRERGPLHSIQLQPAIAIAICLCLDFFGGMQAGMENDIPPIQNYVLKKYGSKESFNKIIDHAIVRLSAWSLIY
jgi:hypothetical protein